MGRCAICKKFKQPSSGPFFKVPSDENKRILWGSICRRNFNPSDVVCADHFSPNVMIGGRVPRLLPIAIPCIKLFDTPLTEKQKLLPITTPHTPNPLQIPFQEPAAAFEATSSTIIVNVPPAVSLLWISNQTIHPSNSETNMNSGAQKKDELINEALFDEKHQNITLEEEVYLKYHTKGIQTDGISGNRISCGFVKTSSTELHKKLYLSCFYCDAEYPISLWSEFSDHIRYKHDELEKDYNEKPVSIISDDCDDTQVSNNYKKIKYNHAELKKCSNEKPVRIIGDDWDDTQVSTNKKAIENEISEINFVNIEIDKPNSVHDSNQGDSNDMPMDDKSFDEIRFDKTPDNILTDFLSVLKGLPGLWDNRNVCAERYDYELPILMDIMKLKWDLNLKKENFKKNLEDIKTWFFTIRDASVKNGPSILENDKLREFYEQCAEFLPFGYLREYSFPCDLCASVFISLTLLQTHKYRQHFVGKLPFSCNKCDKQFCSIYNLYKHLENHSNKGQIIEDFEGFVCYICNNNFTCPNEYKRHLDIHPHGDRQFACEECGRRFKNNHLRNAHQKRHKQTDGFQCEICANKLKDAASFRLHMKIHKGIYDYVCELCGGAFVTQTRYNEHLKFEHMDHGVCRICNRKYKRRMILLKHLRNYHRPTFGTNEELSLPPRKYRIRTIRDNYSKFGKRGPNFKLRKLEYIYDSVTQRNRLKCPLCDNTYQRHRNVKHHALKAHNFDIGTMKRGVPDRSQQQQPSHSDAVATNESKIDSMDTGEVENVKEVILECSNEKLETPFFDNIDDIIVEENEDENSLEIFPNSS